MLERDVRITLDELITAIKENRIDDAEVQYHKLEDLIGKEEAEILFNKIEIILLEE